MTPNHEAALTSLRQAGFFIVAWTPEEVAEIEADDLSALEEALITKGNEFIDEHSTDDDEPGICTACNGSGEGQHDGTRCSSCKGKGVEQNQNDDFDEPERDPIYA